jgi:hypothetical protein
MEVAIVHYWLVTYAGAKRVLEQMLKIWGGFTPKQRLAMAA